MVDIVIYHKSDLDRIGSAAAGFDMSIPDFYLNFLIRNIVEE